MTNAQAGLYETLYLLPAASLPATLDQLSPTIYGDGLMVLRDNWYLVGRAIEVELAARRGMQSGRAAQSVPGPASGTIWLTGLGQFTQLNSNGAPGFSNSTGGVVAGIDFPFLSTLRAGAAIGFTSFDISSRNTARLSGHALQFEAYGSYQEGIAFVDAHAGGGFSEGDATRPLAAFGSQARGQPSTAGGGGMVRGGVHLTMDDWQVEPSVSLGGMSASLAGFTETQGGAAGLSIGSTSVSSVQTLVGVRAERRFALGETMAILPSLQVGWAHEFNDVQGRIPAAFIGLPGSQFVAQSAPFGRDSAIVGLGATFDTGTRVAIHLGYSGALNSRSTVQTVSGGVRVVF